MSQETAIIIGAGPAGLTAAHELLERTAIRPIIFEVDDAIGGLSRTVVHHGYRMDLGGHRFFSKSDRVMDWWLRLMPIEAGKAGAQTIAYQGGRRDIAGSEASAAAPDPDATDRVMLLRERRSRIYFLRKFFDYPLSLTPNTLMRLGIPRTVRVGFSYLRSALFPIRAETNLEEFFINRFGRELYATFFKSYTEKVWGVPCHEISAEWGAQRIKGLSIWRAIAHFAKSLFRRGPRDVAQKDTETSLIEQFLYPKLGPGQIWEMVADDVRRRGGELHLRRSIVGLTWSGTRVTGVRVRDDATGAVTDVAGDYVFSTMPVKDLIAAMGAGVPDEVRRIADGLVYRDFITVGLVVKRLKVADAGLAGSACSIRDNWIYVQEPEVKLGRIQIFNNWSPYLLADREKVSLGLEYFCNEGDELWSMPDAELTAFAAEELARIGVTERGDVLESHVVRVKKSYPAYFGSYDRFDTVRAFTDTLENLFLVGRNGMHRYNNQDHSMLTAMTAVDNIAAGRRDKANIWDVNTQMEYHEERVAERTTAVENLTTAYEQRKGLEDYTYRPDAYWRSTIESYPHYPTVRHRKRWILGALASAGVSSHSFVFDYGCGEGSMLHAARERFGLGADDVGGCDVSAESIQAARARTGSPHLYHDAFPKLERRCSAIVCCETIEHTRDYEHILRWILDHLEPGGTLVLTTQAGPIHASDLYTGHTQHFDLTALRALLVEIGFEVTRARAWGFPLFTVQKYMTDASFARVRTGYLEGPMTRRKRAVFSLAYWAYFLHDAVPFGPQLFLTARRPAGGAA